jgi:polo-like kinase 1
MPSSAAVPMMSTLKNMHQALKHVFESKPGGDGSGRTAGKTAAASGSLENAQSSAARGPTPLKDGNGPETWVTRWVDYTSKYGLGYMLSNGSIGIYFNDSTKIVLSSDGNTFEYMERSSRSRSGSHHAAEVARQKHTLKEYPEALKKKVTLLNSFQGYLQNQESKRKDPANDYELESRARGSGASSMTFVKKWIRTRHAILFRMSNRTVQIRFFDGTEIILTSHGNVVTYVGKQKKQTDPKQQASFSLTDVMSSNRNDITKRLKYTKDILHQLLTGVTKK